MAEVAPAGTFTPMDVTLAVFREVGIEDEDALRCYFTLVGFTLAHVEYQERRPFPALDFTGRLPAEEDPPQAGWDFDAAFAFGLTLILEGIAAAEPDVQSAFVLSPKREMSS